MSDILEDQKLHYIVKDYKRMFEQHNQLVKACKEYQDLLQKRDNRIRDLERQVENLKQAPPPPPPVNLKSTLAEMQNQLNSIISMASKTIDNIEKVRTLTLQ